MLGVMRARSASGIPPIRRKMHWWSFASTSILPPAIPTSRDMTYQSKKSKMSWLGLSKIGPVRTEPESPSGKPKMDATLGLFTCQILIPGVSL